MARAAAGRLLAAGACSYSDLSSGRLSLKDFYELLRILDWNDYQRARLAEALREVE